MATGGRVAMSRLDNPGSTGDGDGKGTDRARENQERMAIDPRIEEPLRDLLEHAIRCELDDVARVMVEMGDESYSEALALLVQASAYIVIDTGKRWPVEPDLREAARIAAESVTNLPVTEDEMYVYLLLSFTPKNQHWSDYLDTTENAIEVSEQASLSVLPSLTYRHRFLSAHTGQNVRPSTS
jgi:hypothetical protein